MLGPMRALDTTADADEAQASIQRRLGPEGRLKVAMEMSEIARRLARAGLRARHPELAQGALDARLIRDHYGFDIGRR
jgi:hypothetical protein